MVGVPVPATQITFFPFIQSASPHSSRTVKNNILNVNQLAITHLQRAVK
jgi:hypothetical protein